MYYPDNPENKFCKHIQMPAKQVHDATLSWISMMCSTLLSHLVDSKGNGNNKIENKNLLKQILNWHHGNRAL